MISSCIFYIQSISFIILLLYFNKFYFFYFNILIVYGWTMLIYDDFTWQ